MKRNLKYILICLMLLSSMFLIFACKENKDGKKQFSLNITQLETVIGDKNNLFILEDVNDDLIVWKSDNEAVAKVSTNGIVESIGVGSTIIKAIYDGCEMECKIDVSLGAGIPQLLIKNQKNKYRIGLNEQNFYFEPYVLFNGNEYEDAQIEFLVSDEQIATVDANGKIIVKNKGNVDVTIIALWRGLDYKEWSSLRMVIEIEIVDEVYFYVSGNQYDVIKLSTVEEFEGKNYINKIDFIPSVEINGKAYNNVQVVLPEELVVVQNNVLQAIGYGTGNLILNCIDSFGVEYTGSIGVEITRPMSNNIKEYDYFSTTTGMIKDVDNNFENITLARKLFGNDNEEGYKVTYKNNVLEVQNGKIFGIPNDYKGSYKAELTVESNKVVHKVVVNVYSVVVQNGQDLKLFQLEKLAEDNPLTLGIDETRITCIDGYSIMINDIDASGISINHSALNATYSYMNKDGVSSSTKFDEVVKRYNSSTANGSTYDSQLQLFGFIGTFDGNGHTIFNLDTSVNSDEIGGGLFGCVMGNAKICNVGFASLNISNSSGLGYIQSVTGGRIMPQDKRGLRTDNTVIENIYIKLSDKTTCPKGALFNKTFNTMGLIDLNNIIIDASNVTKGVETSGGVFLFDGASLCAQNIPNRFYSRNVYLIGKNYPACFASNVIVFGQNEANGNEIDGRYNGNVFSSKFERYDDFDDFKLGNVDFSSFEENSSWIIVDGYPQFLTAKGVYLNFDGEMILDNVIRINSSSKDKQISLTTINGDLIEIDSWIYDQDELTIDDENIISLVKDITEEEVYWLTINYTFNNESSSIKVKVLAYPELFEINVPIQLSSYNGATYLQKYINDLSSIKTIQQVVDGETYNLNLSKDGKLVGSIIKIKPDYSDVFESKLIVLTPDMEYRFQNVKIYSHIISQKDDLMVFRQTKSSGRITGYYILTNNIDATGFDVSHDNTIYSDLSYDNMHAFQGVFDGKGYCIENLRLGVNGLFGAVLSDSKDNGGKSIIRNLSLTKVQAIQETSQFSIFGHFLEGLNNAKTELSNINISIDNTYLTSYDPTNNFKGLFYMNKSEYVDSFRFTNIYLEILSEQIEEMIYRGYGSIFTYDLIGVSSSVESRSNRFNNVITVTKLNPCVWRQFVGTELTTEFDGMHMYVVYSEEDIGGNGVKCKWLEEGSQYYHNPIAENKNKGSYIFNNVYRYDSYENVESSKIETLVQTGLWEVYDGKLSWKSTLPYRVVDKEINFDIDWIEIESNEQQTINDTINFDIDWLCSGE